MYHCLPVAGSSAAVCEGVRSRYPAHTVGREAAPALSAGAHVSAEPWAGGRAAARGPGKLLLLFVIIGGSLKRGDNN